MSVCCLYWMALFQNRFLISMTPTKPQNKANSNPLTPTNTNTSPLNKTLDSFRKGNLERVC